MVRNPTRWPGVIRRAAVAGWVTDDPGGVAGQEMDEPATASCCVSSRLAFSARSRRSLTAGPKMYSPDQAVAAHHTVARDQDGHRVAPEGGPSRARTAAGPADLAGEPPVRSGLAPGDLRRLGQDGPLEIARAAEVEAQVGGPGRCAGRRSGRPAAGQRPGRPLEPAGELLGEPSRVTAEAGLRADIADGPVGEGDEGRGPPAPGPGQTGRRCARPDRRGRRWPVRPTPTTAGRRSRP